MYVFARMFVHIQVGVCSDVYGGPMVSFIRNYLPCFLTESVTGLELVTKAGLVGSDPWGSPCLHFVLGLQTNTTTLAPPHSGFWGLNVGSQACKASALLTELSP